MDVPRVFAMLQPGLVKEADRCGNEKENKDSGRSSGLCHVAARAREGS